MFFFFLSPDEERPVGEKMKPTCLKHWTRKKTKTDEKQALLLALRQNDAHGLCLCVSCGDVVFIHAHVSTVMWQEDCVRPSMTSTDLGEWNSCCFYLIWMDVKSSLARAVNLLLYMLKCAWKTRRSIHQCYLSLSKGLKLQLLVCRPGMCTEPIKYWFNGSEALRNASLHFPERLKATRCSICHANVSQSDTPCSDAIFGMTG